MEEQAPKLLQVVDAWLDILIDKLHEGLDTYDIGKLDGNLWRSIVGQVISSGGDVESVIVKFAQYGRFVDMGVGRGMPTGSRSDLGEKKFSKKRNSQGQLHRYNRKRKPWYSKTKYRELARLRELMASGLTDQILIEVENSFRNYNISG